MSVVDTGQVQEPVQRLHADVLTFIMPTTVHASKHIISAVDPGVPGELYPIGPGEYPLPHVGLLLPASGNRDTNRRMCVDAAVKRLNVIIARVYDRLVCYTGYPNPETVLAAADAVVAAVMVK